MLLLPGFLAGDGSLRTLASSLEITGHQPHTAGIRYNVGCSEATVRRIDAALDRLAQSLQQRVTLVGHSRGGFFARVIARRRPDLVSAVITLASPYRDQLAIHPLLWASVAALATAGTLGVPGVLRWSCGGFGCCADFARDLASPLPADIGVLSVYSRRDGVVDWRACIDPAGRSLEVSATHCGMLAHAPTLWAVATAVAEFSTSSRG